MSGQKIQRAFVSVYDKTDIVAFANSLIELGIEIISTGGTARLLRENKIPVTMVEDVTGFGEMLDGRVKSLHPKIHGAILADRDNPEHLRQLKEQGITPIDMVVVNLYPFEETVADPNCTIEQAIEMIDIGGPCLLRAAAKNHQHVVVVSDVEQYSVALDWIRSGVASEQRIELARAAFERTMLYDSQTQSYLRRVVQNDKGLEFRLDEQLQNTLLRHEELRYGENPHQYAGRYADAISEARPEFVQVAGPSMSFNNYVDANAALQLCQELTLGIRGQSIAVCIKHTNACGVGISDDSIESYRLAYLGDPLAAMGGVLAQNARVDAKLATAVMESLSRWGRDAGAGAFFVEVWVAPEFDEPAIDLIKSKKKWGERVRLLTMGKMSIRPDLSELDFKKITGGMLVQTRDSIGLNDDDWKVVTKREPTDRERADLRLAWLICKHTKSNAITICKDGMLIGNGAGQMSRVMSGRIATWLAKENDHGERLAGSVAASDAFFPFRDGPEILIRAGVAAMIQPGGSKRDNETIAVCNENDVAMIFTGTRHFKH